MALLYLFFNMGQVKLSMDKYLMAIYLSLGKYIEDIQMFLLNMSFISIKDIFNKKHLNFLFIIYKFPIIF